MKVHKIVFDRAITTRDLQEQLAVAVGLNRLANVILKAKGDTIITISPTMLANNSRLVAKVNVQPQCSSGEKQKQNIFYFSIDYIQQRRGGLRKIQSK